MEKDKPKTLLFLDSESLGIVGDTKLIQFATKTLNEETGKYGDYSPVEMIPLYQDWYTTDTATQKRVKNLFSLLSRTSTTLFAFNSAFDTFKLYQANHLLHHYDPKSREHIVPAFKCKVIDLAIHAAKYSDLAPYAMSGKAVAYITKIPTKLVETVAKYIKAQLLKSIPEVLHENLSYSVHDVKGTSKLKDISFTLKRNLKLKTLMKHYGLNTLELKNLWHLPRKVNGKSLEKAHLPYNQPCHDEINKLNEEIMRDPKAPFWKYAELDILYLEYLWEKLGKPIHPDYNDTSTHAVGYTRYAGIPLDYEVLKRTRKYYQDKITIAEEGLGDFNFNSSQQKVKLLQKYEPFVASAKKEVLQALIKAGSKAAHIAQQFLDYGENQQRLKQIEKVIECKTGRIHPEFRVYGTSTDRMAGSGGVNFQGISSATEDEEGNPIGLRAAILTNSGGDFKNLEVALLADVYKVKNLIAEIDAGIDLHSNRAVSVLPDVLEKGITYEEFEKIRKDHDHEFNNFVNKMRQKAKGVGFALQFMGNAHTLDEIVGEGNGQEVYDLYFEHYSEVRDAMDEMGIKFLTADTEKWSADCIDKMAEYAENIFGGRRYFKFEKEVAKILWRIGQEGIPGIPEGVIIRQEQKGIQSLANAVKSACLGAAINIQNKVFRRAFNATIQPVGSIITKTVFSNLFLKFRLISASIHDEIISYRDRGITHDEVNEVVQETIREIRKEKDLPHLSMTFDETPYWNH